MPRCFFNDRSRAPKWNILNSSIALAPEAFEPPYQESARPLDRRLILSYKAKAAAGKNRLHGEEEQRYRNWTAVDSLITGFSTCLAKPVVAGEAAYVLVIFGLKSVISEFTFQSHSSSSRSEVGGAQQQQQQRKRQQQRRRKVSYASLPIRDRRIARPEADGCGLRRERPRIWEKES